tara:strand:- start:107 stop:517 length:411 start_codon:yes stop_codon:yes gene_type:complete
VVDPGHSPPKVSGPNQSLDWITVTRKVTDMYIIRYIVACVVWTYKVRAINVKFVNLTAWYDMDQYTESEIWDECAGDFDDAREQVESKYNVKLNHSPHYFDYEFDDIYDYGNKLFSRRNKIERLNDYDNRNVTFVI